MKTLTTPQAIVVSVIFLGTLAAIGFYAKQGLDPTPVLVFGGGLLAALGLGAVGAQVMTEQKQIKENTNGTSAAQLATIRHLAAMAAVSQPTPELQALAAQLVSLSGLGPAGEAPHPPEPGPS